MINQLIERYKRFRTEQYLAQIYQYQYAFVGIGQHSLSNLYPVIRYLQIPIKYICVTSERKAQLIEKKFPWIKGTTSLDEILNDDTIKGVFVSTSPAAQFSTASRVLQSGKSLFVEKPPCLSLEQLHKLIELRRLYHSQVVAVGMQKRYAPAIRIVQKRLKKEHLINYDMHYLTGAYPEGNVLLDLYIHPLDLACYLFGEAEIIACQKVAPSSFLLMLKHPHVIGTIELSTVYSWISAKESLKVCTNSGVYYLEQMEELTYESNSTFCGFPVEKILREYPSIEILYRRNNFTPVLANNQVYTHGYFDEILSFANAVEGRQNNNISDLISMTDTFELLEELSSVS